MAFHFDSSPNEQVMADLRGLSHLNKEQLVELSHLTLVFVAQLSKDFSTDVASFSSKYQMNMKPLKNLLRSYIVFFRGSISQQLTEVQLTNDLTEIGVTAENAAAVCEKWKEFSPALAQAAASRTLRVNELLDMEWRFGVTSANSDLEQVGSTFLQLKLVLDKGSHRENVFMELTLPQFYQFLSDIEKAKTVLDLFS
eukprot:GILK01001177.1.p1 GENE.GILK01001177.1~~GILK01001177.1.p1  ORF type:complete len:197 (-),score=35.13 GILK01001177.1:789-1379(-)